MRTMRSVQSIVILSGYLLLTGCGAKPSYELEIDRAESVVRVKPEPGKSKIVFSVAEVEAEVQKETGCTVHYDSPDRSAYLSLKTSESVPDVGLKMICPPEG